MPRCNDKMPLLPPKGRMALTFFQCCMLDYFNIYIPSVHLSISECCLPVKYDLKNASKLF